VPLDHQVDLLPNRIRGIAHLRHLVGPLGEGARLARARVPAVGVDAQALMHTAAQQAPDGDAEALSQDVPTRDLDRAHGLLD